jgi:hypothetical protein
MVYTAFIPFADRSLWPWRITREPGFPRTAAMTIEILYLSLQIHRWLDRAVARHLAAQAARFGR